VSAPQGATNTNQNTAMKNINTHTNANGIAYYSTADENGETIYSFTEDFEDTWSQDDEDCNQ
jgi:hypothetical protein